MAEDILGSAGFWFDVDGGFAYCWSESSNDVKGESKWKKSKEKR